VNSEAKQLQIGVRIGVYIGPVTCQLQLHFFTEPTNKQLLNDTLYATHPGMYPILTSPMAAVQSMLFTLVR